MGRLRRKKKEKRETSNETIENKLENLSNLRRKKNVYSMSQLRDTLHTVSNNNNDESQNAGGKRKPSITEMLFRCFHLSFSARFSRAANSQPAKEMDEEETRRRNKEEEEECWPWVGPSSRKATWQVSGDRFNSYTVDRLNAVGRSAFHRRPVQLDARPLFRLKQKAKKNNQERQRRKSRQEDGRSRCFALFFRLSSFFPLLFLLSVHNPNGRRNGRKQTAIIIYCGRKKSGRQLWASERERRFRRQKGLWFYFIFYLFSILLTYCHFFVVVVIVVVVFVLEENRCSLQRV